MSERHSGPADFVGRAPDGVRLDPRRPEVDEAGHTLAFLQPQQHQGFGRIAVPVVDPVGAIAHGLGGDQQLGMRCSHTRPVRIGDRMRQPKQ